MSYWNKFDKKWNGEPFLAKKGQNPLKIIGKNVKIDQSYLAKPNFSHKGALLRNLAELFAFQNFWNTYWKCDDTELFNCEEFSLLWDRMP